MANAYSDHLMDDWEELVITKWLRLTNFYVLINVNDCKLMLWVITKSLIWLNIDIIYAL